MSDQKAKVLYCRCAYAQVVPEQVKQEVLRRLSGSEVTFEAVADLCEMSARRDPELRRLASEGEIKIAACYPRAVKWLFTAANASLDPTKAEVLNMRVQSAEEINQALLETTIHPNLPEGNQPLSEQEKPAGKI